MLPTKRLTLTALSAAIVFAATFFLRIPFNSGGGEYINAGDFVIYMVAAAFGPFAGFFAGGIGSLFSDLLAGAFYYAPATFIIKGLMGLLVGLFAHKHKILTIASFYLAGFWMVFGYFWTQFALVRLGLIDSQVALFAAAVSSIPLNLIQCFVCAIAATVFLPAWRKIGLTIDH